MDHLGEHLEALEHQVHTIQRRLRLWRSLTCGVLGLYLLSFLQPWGLDAQGQDGSSRGSLWQRVSALERTLTHVSSVTGEGGRPEVVITGANLRIVNGLRGTATANGVGNLLLGYNEPRHDGDNERTGSHNLVVGLGHNFSSFGGLVVGRNNAIRGAFASVSGGFDNTASGNAASVSGGDGNTARGHTAAVSGGHGNTASGHTATISGGEANTARGFSSSVSGGQNRRAEWDFDWATASAAVSSDGHRDTASSRTISSRKPRW